LSDFDLQRFVRAQNDGNVFARALAELAAGLKRSHWMWFVFPQIQGLGASAMAQRYAIVSLDEARVYLAHAVLGPRMRQCVETILSLEESDPRRIFGGIDAMKLRSSLTLFEAAAAGDDKELFARGLEKFFAGERDEATLSRL
jgi:uncharacterized protein (DUF1810 family)